MKFALFALLAVIACQFVVCDISWSTLTAEQLAQLSPSVFKSVSTSELRSIPPLSCKGFSIDQISNVTSYSCDGFKAQCLSNINATSYAGFTSGCFKYLLGSEVHGIDASQLEHVAPESFSQISTSVLKGFTSSCSGFTPSQISMVSAYSCDGFVAQCFANMTAKAYSGFQPGCIKYFKSTEVQGISAEGISSIEPSSIAGFSTDSLGGLSPTSCSGFNVNQTRHFSQYSCDGFTAQCLKNFNTNAVEGFTAGCVKYFKGSALSLITKEQLSAFNATNAFTTNVLKGLNTGACAGFRSSQISSLSQYSCDGLTGGCLENIDAPVFSSFQTGCAKYFTSDALSMISGGQLSQFTSNVLQTLSTLALQGLNPFACEAFNMERISLLGYSCDGLTIQCIANISAVSIGGLTGTCTRYMQPQVLASFSNDQLTHLTDVAVSGITAVSFGQLINAKELSLVNLLSYYQLRRVSVSTIFMLKTKYITQPKKVITGQQLPGLTWLQLAYATNGSLLSSIDKTSITTIQYLSIQGLNAFIVSHAPNDIFANSNTSFFYYLLPDAIAAVQGRQLPYMTPSAFSADGIAEWFIYLSPSIMQYLSYDQLSNFVHIQNITSQYLTCEQYASFNESQIKFIQKENEKFANDLQYHCSGPQPSGSYSHHELPKKALYIALGVVFGVMLLCAVGAAAICLCLCRPRNKSYSTLT